MAFDLMAVMTLGLAICFLSGAESAPCPSSTVDVNVFSTADVQNLTDVLVCTGEGAFNITWHSSLAIARTFEVSDQKNVTVTGIGFPSIRGALADGHDDGAVGDTGDGDGIFSVSNGSILYLNHLVLEGGNAENGGAVELRSSSSVVLLSCTFTNNNASSGGAIYASTSAIYIAGNTSFDHNSAQFGGVIYMDENSAMKIDGSTSFVNNIAEYYGGAIVGYDNASININGNTSFANNTARGYGGAVYLYSSSFIKIDGSTSFLNNTTDDDGGAMAAELNAAININGNALFGDNAATESGGALFASQSSSIDIDGNNIFLDNFSGFFGGALYAAYSSSVEVDGNIMFDNNFAATYGGAIYLGYSSSLKIDGSTSFLNNMADDDGGAMGVYGDVSIKINGNASFVNNAATESGGALYASQSCSVEVDGTSIFDSNSAAIDGGAVYLYGNSSLHIDGRTSILNNLAETDGGGMRAAASSSIYINGDTHICNNSADNGGAAYILRSSSLNINGNTSFHRNSAGNSGGVIYASESRIHIDGHTSVTHNTANSPGGGALFTSQSDIRLDGYTYIAHNSGYDGGVILAQESAIHITGDAIFADNSAKRDGGAIKTTDTSLTIGTNTQEAELSSTSALAGGFTTSTQQWEVHSIGTISFIQNAAFDYGGAISLANPVKLNISDVTFGVNEAESGGAVALTSTVWAPAEFQRCRFEHNKATRGGAVYFSGDGQRILEGSSFLYNVAEEMGGALLNAGSVEIKDTVFAENTATDGGLAIQNIESDMVLWNVTFDGNILSCPLQTYSYTQHTSVDSCRLELACAQCLDGCESDLSNVTIDRETLPTCEPIPQGVWPSSTAITLQTFDIKEGYYRVSTESPIVLECYQKDACIGGTNPSNYCAIGYEGPYCAVCTEGYVPGSSSRCHRCSEENKGLAVGFSAAVLAVVLFVAFLVVSDLLQVVGDGTDDTQNELRRWWQGRLSPLRKFLVKAIPMSAIRIVVVVLQIVVQFTEIAGAVYPDEYEAFLSTMAPVNFDIGSIMSSSCLLRTDFYDRLVISTVSPLVILLACAGTFFIAKMRNRTCVAAGPIVKHKHLSVGLFLVFFVYSSVSFTIFQTFVCDPLDDGNAYLRADYSITCYTELHTAYLVYASLMVCVYPIGIPAFFVWWLVLNRQELEKPERETISQLQSYRCLWAAYKPASYYYEVVECGRRIVLTGAAVFVLPDSAEQVAVVLFFAVVFMFVSESVSPFESKTDMWLYRWGNGIILASMYVALLLKVDLAVEESRSSSAMTALLIAANVFMIFTVAVEAILLMRGSCVSKESEETTLSVSSQNRAAEQASSNSELEITWTNPYRSDL